MRSIKEVILGMRSEPLDMRIAKLRERRVEIDAKLSTARATIRELQLLAAEGDEAARRDLERAEGEEARLLREAAANRTAQEQLGAQLRSVEAAARAAARASAIDEHNRLRTRRTAAGRRIEAAPVGAPDVLEAVEMTRQLRASYAALTGARLPRGAALTVESEIAFIGQWISDRLLALGFPARMLGAMPFDWGNPVPKNMSWDEFEAKYLEAYTVTD